MYKQFKKENKCPHPHHKKGKTSNFSRSYNMNIIYNKQK